MSTPPRRRGQALAAVLTAAALTLTATSCGRVDRTGSGPSVDRTSVYPAPTPTKTLSAAEASIAAMQSVVASSAAAYAASIAAHPSDPSTAAPVALVAPAELAEPVVKYLVFGGSYSTASMTFSDANGQTSQDEDQRSPWTHVVKNARSGTFLYVSAQNNADYGNVGCEITVNDRIVAANVSHGGFSIVDCHAEMP